MSSIIQNLFPNADNATIGTALVSVLTLAYVLPNVYIHIVSFYGAFIVDNRWVASTSEKAVDQILKKNSTTYLKGHVAIVTGTTIGGIGAHTALLLAGRADVQVVCAGRTMSKLEACEKYILKEYPNAKLTLMVLDVSSFKSVRDFVTEFKKKFPEDKYHLGCLVNNAGIMANPYKASVDGLELQMATNHLGPFLLTNLLLPRLKSGAAKLGEARIINVASMAHALPNMAFGAEQLNKVYTLSMMGPMFAYGRSKRANILTAKSLAMKLKGTNVLAFSLCPGNVSTNLGQNNKVARFLYNNIPIHKNVSQGAATTLHLALNPNMASYTGKYFVDLKPASTAWCGDSLCEEIFQGSLVLSKLTKEEIDAAWSK
jgi:NAD(P)-dependent dehydrogenase (short-subunit alcohol dehydrogenase family)